MIYKVYPGWLSFAFAAYWLHSVNCHLEHPFQENALIRQENGQELIEMIATPSRRVK